MPCSVCDGLGEYCIVDHRGGVWGCITCSACKGDGLDDAEAISAMESARVRRRYDEVMTAMRQEVK